MLPKNYALRYPFSQLALDELKRLGSDLEITRAFRSHLPIIDRLKGLIIDAFDHKEYSHHLQEESQENLLIFPLLKFILAMVDNMILTHHIVNLVSKHYSVIMANEPEKIILELATLHGIKVIFQDGVMGIDFVSWLHFASNIKDPNWKLVNAPLTNGIVVSTYADIIRLIQEGIKMAIITNVKDIQVRFFQDKRVKDEYLQEFAIKIFFDEIKAIIAKYEEKHYKDTGNEPVQMDESAFPACIAKIIKDALAGRNLNHSERLYMVTFLHHAGSSNEFIFSLFKNSPDLDENKTRYQIDHLTGQKSGKKAYLPYSCDKAQSLNLCPAKCDTKAKSPLTAYRHNIKKKQAQEKTQKPQEPKPQAEKPKEKQE